MNSVPLIWSAVAVTCLNLALMQGLVWSFQRRRTDRLVSALMALVTASMALSEIPMMKAETPAAFARALQWQHVPVFLNFLAIIGFVHLHLEARRPALAWCACGLRLASLILNFTTGENLNYLQVTGLTEVRFLGDTISLPEGIRNPAMIVGQAALLCLVAYVLDATVTTWRLGHRQKACLAGGGILFFVLAGTGVAILSHWHFIRLPATASLYFTGAIVVMALDLSLDALRAGRLSEELRETRESRYREVAHLSRAATVGSLSTSIAHEINQPLGTILLNAQTALRLLARPNPRLAEVREILDEIVRENQRAGEVIQRLRNLLRRGEVQPIPLHLNQLVLETLGLMRSALRDRRVQVTPQLDDEAPAVRADPIQLQQVLINLINNACDAMAGNAEDDRPLRIETGGRDGGVELRIRDAGSGLPGEPGKIFEPFFTTKPQGLGMGLAICRSIVDAHRGRLWATPGTDRGTTLHLWLPASQDSP